MAAMAKLAAVGVTAVVLSAVLRKNTPELALLLALAAGLWMLAMAAEGMGAAVALMEELAEQAGLSEVLLEPVVKTVALSILTRLTAEICRSAGEGGVAAFVETAGAVLALLAALPLIRAVAQMMGELLAEIDVGRRLVQRLVGQFVALALAFARDVAVPRLAAEAEEVDARREAVAAEELHALVCRDARHAVARAEAVVEGRLVGGVSVVDAVAAPVAEEAHRTRGLLVAVLHGHRGRAARDALVVVEDRRGHRSGIRGVEMRDVGVGRDVPRVGDAVAQAEVAAVLLESHACAVSVGAGVGGACGAGEASRPHAVRDLGLQRVPRAVAQVGVGVHAVALCTARDDVDYAAHGV